VVGLGKKKKIVCPIMYFAKKSPTSHFENPCSKNRTICCLHCEDLEKCSNWVCPKILQINKRAVCHYYGITEDELERIYLLSHLSKNDYGTFLDFLRDYHEKRKEENEKFSNKKTN